jgi:hypothetical protein
MSAYGAHRTAFLRSTAPLARLEMRVAMEELLARTTRIEPTAGTPPTGAVYPASGFATLSLRNPIGRHAEARIRHGEVQHRHHGHFVEPSSGALPLGPRQPADRR